MTPIQSHALAQLKQSLELCRLAGLAMTPTTGGAHVMYRRSKRVWYRAPGGKLQLPDVPEMIANEDAEATGPAQST